MQPRREARVPHLCRAVNGWMQAVTGPCIPPGVPQHQARTHLQHIACVPPCSPICAMPVSQAAAGLGPEACSSAQALACRPPLSVHGTG